jgi:hypothetical protein
VRHHRNYNHFDNRPENLELLDVRVHARLHKTLGLALQRPSIERKRKRRHAAWSKRAVSLGQHPFQTPQARIRAAELGRKSLVAYNKSQAHRSIAGATGRKALAELRKSNKYVEMMRQVASANGKRNMAKLRADPDFQSRLNASHQSADVRRKLSQQSRKQWEDPKYRKKMVLLSRSRRAETSYNFRCSLHRRWHSDRSRASDTCEFCRVNHKVAAVRPAGKSDVYDLEVDGTHNFALAAGVFVHNCDACQSESYTINDVAVSNFVLPLYFTPEAEAGERTNFMNQPLASFGVAAGSYVGFYDPTKGDMDTYMPRGDAQAKARLAAKKKLGMAHRLGKYQQRTAGKK